MFDVSRPEKGQKKRVNPVRKERALTPASIRS